MAIVDNLQPDRGRAISESLLRSPIARLFGVLIVLLILAIQPNPLRLIEITDATRHADSAGSVLPLLIEGYDRQPWNAGRAEAIGYGALLSGEYETASEMFTIAGERAGWSATLRTALGDAQNGLGDIEGAVAQWEAALLLAPKDENTLVRLSTTYEGQGRYLEAARLLDELVLIRPTDAYTHFRLGLINAVVNTRGAPEHLALAGGLNPALRPATNALSGAVEFALSLDETAPGAGLIGYALINLQEFGLAEAALQTAIASDSQYGDAYAYLGLAEDQQGRDGLESYQHALELNPESAVAHTFLGLYWKRNGARRQALRSLERAYELDPLNAGVSAELGSLYQAGGDFPSADEWYSNAVRLAPTDASFWTLLANFYIENDFMAIERGLSTAEAAAEHGPIYAPAHVALGRALLLTGDLQNAENSLLRAIELDQELADAYLHLGLVYVEAEQLAAATNALQIALSLDPDGPIGNLALNTLARLPQE